MQLNLLDYFIIGIVIISALTGLRRGFLDALGGIVGIIAASIGAFVYYDDFAALLEEKFGVGTVIAGIIRDKLPMPAVSTEPGLVHNYLSSGLINADPAQHLAQLLLMIMSFFLIILAVCATVKLLFKALEAVFSHGFLDWVNRVMGMILAIAKNMLIVTLILGIVYPLLEAAAKMGLQGALNAVVYINSSIMAAKMLNAFMIFKAVMGLSV